jgi:protein phosphatase
VLQTAKWFFRLDDPDENVRMRLLREGLERIDRKLIAEAKADPSLEGMGTTLTAASSIGTDLFLVHVGDSRAYLYRQGKLAQLTRDHTLIQKLVDSGLLTPEQAKTHKLRNVLTNVLGGGEPGVVADIHRLQLADGDRLLLCTDGLTEGVSDEQLAELLRLYPKPADACQALVEAALNAGGRDNITLILAAYSIDS